MKDPRQFSDFSDDPRNNGWGINGPNPYDNYPDEPDKEIKEGDDEIENEDE